MRELHLFSGAGGGILGSLLLGHTPVCAVEINEYCRRVLKQRIIDGLLPEMELHGDIRDFDGSVWRGRVDVVAGGWPCQDLSIAWKGKGLDGERSGLFFELARVVREVEPEWVFLENVPALHTRGLDTVLGELAKSGYDAAWTTLSAAACGASHVRRRIWILAHANGSGRGKQRGPGAARPEHACGQCSDYVPGTHSSGCPEQQDCQSRFFPLGYRPVIFGAECDDDTGQCPCGLDYASECLCPGPTEDGFEYREFGQNLYGRRCFDYWQNEPGICRVVDGVADRVDRIRAVGNGQVPIVAATAWRILEGAFGGEYK